MEKDTDKASWSMTTTGSMKVRQELSVGDWECDYKHGQGFERFIDGCVYEGGYVNGKPEGVGRYSWTNGEFYQGEWVNGAKHGLGMWKGSRGDSYIG
jgi:hypothetical protein